MMSQSASLLEPHGTIMVISIPDRFVKDHDLGCIKEFESSKTSKKKEVQFWYGTFKISRRACSHLSTEPIGTRTTMMPKREQVKPPLSQLKARSTRRHLVNTFWDHWFKHKPKASWTNKILEITEMETKLATRSTPFNNLMLFNVIQKQ